MTQPSPSYMGRRGAYILGSTGGGGGGGGGGADGTRPSVPHSRGSVINSYIHNATVGIGGDYPDGNIWLAGGEYTFEPINTATGYMRGASPGAGLFNNWLRIREWDGPNTVNYNCKADSAGSFNNIGGGGLYVPLGVSGSLRLIFDGGHFHDGCATRIADQGAGRVIWWNCTGTYPIAEWTRQHNAAPNNMKGNDDAATWRWHAGGHHLYVIRCLGDEIADDGVFVGGTMDTWAVIGSGFSRVDNHGVNTTNFHNDGIQLTGGNNGKIFDNTFQGHSLEIAAEPGYTIQNTNFDRNWSGMCVGDGGDIGSNGGQIAATTVFAAGAPTNRISGHFMKTWSNGTGHPEDVIAQTALITGANGYQAGWVYYPDAVKNLAVLNSGSFTVEVPSGCAVEGRGFATTSIDQFMAAANVPHQVFRTAYGPNEFLTVLSHYGVLLD